MSILETPKKVREDVENVIDQLNDAWPGLDLCKPGDKNRWAQSGQVTKSIGLHIKSLFIVGIDIQGVILRFNICAKKVASAWIEKPSQQEETLPARAAPSTFIKSNLLSQSNQRPLSSDLQQQLLAILDGMLQAEGDIARSSMKSTDAAAENLSNRPQSQAQQSEAEFSNASRTSVSMAKKKGSKQSKAPEASTTTKRSSTTANNEPSRIPQKVSRQSAIMDQYFRVKPSIDSNPTAPKKTASTQPMSFKSALSPSQQEIFTPDLSNSSNDTSLLSLEDLSGAPSEDLMPEASQELLDSMESPVRRSFLEPERERSPILVDLEKNGPFSASRQLPLNLSFAFRYEVHRVAESFGKTPSELFSAINRKLGHPEPSYDYLWGIMKNIGEGLGKKLTDRSAANAWEAAETKFEDKKTGYSVNLAGNLEWAESGSAGVFKFTLAPLKLDKSCRFHRRFGPDRFIAIKIPFFTPEKDPQERDKKSKTTHFYESICDWLAKSTHDIAGRKWRLFWLEAEKKRRTDAGHSLRAHLFAVDGVDFQIGGSHAHISDTKDWRTETKHHPLGVDALIYWHLRIQQNLDESCTDLKSFSRFSLGLSRTSSTPVVLEAEEFLPLEDSPGKVVMNDGCALISFKLAKQIAEHLGLNGVPSAMQGRVSGAKGLWMTDYNDSFPYAGKRGYWIQVSDSQLKIQPHPRMMPDADPEQRTFEILKVSTPAKPAFLNNQLLQILAYHEVPKLVLSEILTEDIKGYFDNLFLSMKSTPKLRDWVQKYHRLPRSKDPIKRLCAFPDTKEERVSLLLESGFTPEKCGTLNKLLVNFLTDHLSQYVEKLHIKMPNSTTLFCIADPYDVLDEGEVYLGFSELWTNPVTDRQDYSISDIEVLVARNPAHLPSDIQKVRAVFKEQLRHFRDVIVFPTKGKTPLASLLSGGDYDGDTVWACWDPQLLKGFENSPKPENSLSEEECGIVRKSRPMSEVFNASKICTSAVDDFIGRCVWFAAHSPLLGFCTIEHEKVVYHGGELSSPDSIKLATLASYLVDASKQGYLLTDSAWMKLRSKISPVARSLPAYKGSVPPKTSITGFWGGYTDVIDLLKFGVAGKVQEDLLKKFYTDFPCEDSYDEDLKKLWKTARSRIAKDPGNPRSKTLKKVLDDLEQKVKSLIDDYKIATTGRMVAAEKKNPADKTRSFDGDSPTFVRTVTEFYENFVAIQPLQVDHDIWDRFEEEKKRPFSDWTALRASCAYYHCRSRFVWDVAGFDLCKMKAESLGDCRTIVAFMHNLMKVDGKLTERVTSGEEYGDDMGNDLPDEDDEQSFMEDWILHG